jgi:chemotaxis protein MotA
MTPVPPNALPKPIRKKHLNSGVILGVALAFGGVLAALLLQGGEPADLLQWSSTILLLSGTAGAVLITTPLNIIQDALKSAAKLFSRETFDTVHAVALMGGLSRKAMRLGVSGLEAELDEIEIPFLREAVSMASDGLTVEEVANRMKLETRLTQKRLDRQAHVFETAGGYAPTLGILGAVLGLIQVMKHLGEMTAVGHGIAAAFVSTIYGLALANLVLLPIAGRLRAASAQEIETQELLTDGVICLMEKLHPKLIEARLAPYLLKAGEGVLHGRGNRLQIALAKGA